MIREDPSKIELKAKVKPEVLFKISRMKEVIKPSRPHRHDNYSEIIYLSEGEGYHTIDFEKYQVKPGSLFFLNPGQVHCWEFTKVPKGFVIIFKDDLFIRHNLFTGSFKSERIGISSYLDLKNSEKEIEDLILRIEKEYVGGLRENDRVIAHYIQILLVTLKRLSSDAHQQAILPQQHLVQEFSRLLDTYFIEKKFVTQYADMLNVSAKYLNKPAGNKPEIQQAG